MPDVSVRFEDLSIEQQEYLVQFLADNFVPVQKINQKHSAYGLKQTFTRQHFYVTQEQFTEAMRRAGFQVEELKSGNARFNIGDSSPYFHASK